MSAEIAMIEHVEKHRCLYDYGMPEYNRKDIADEAWGQVAAALNLSIPECRDKWKNIRSSYVRSLKKSKSSYYLAAYLQFLLPYIKKPKSPDAVTLNFNDDDDAGEQEDEDISEKSDTNEHTHYVKMEPDNDPISDAEMYNDDDDYSPSPPQPVKAKRRKRTSPRKSNSTHKITKSNKPSKILLSDGDSNSNRKSSNVSDSTNAMRYFLLSLLPELETMDIEQLRIFKIKVMMLIDEIKGDQHQARESLRTSGDSERLQKRLINLLLKNLERQAQP